MKIAILDDVLEDIYRIQDLILDIQGSYRIDHFQEGSALLDAVAKGENYDLLFCDIFMQNENGMDVARNVQLALPQTRIVFITCSREHAVEAFSINALHYLVKPVEQEDMIEVFQRLEKKADPRHILAIQINRTMNILYQDEIIRVESHGHNTVITCTGNSTYSIRKPFSEIYEMLDQSFIQIKKRLALNMHYITRMTFKECITRDGFTFLLRRDQARQIREKYYAFVRQELTL